MSKKLLEVYGSLSREERKQLKQFVQFSSPTVSKEAQALFNFLYDNYTKKVFVPTEAFKFLFKARAYDHLVYRRTASDLLKAIERFLIHNELKKDNDSAQLYLAKAYRKRKLPKHFESTIKAAKKRKEKEHLAIQDYYFNLCMSQEANLQKDSERDPSLKTNLEKMGENLDIFFVVNKLKQLCAKQSYKNVLSEVAELHFEEEVLNFVHQHQLLNVPLISLYYHTYKMQTEGDKNYFIQVKTAIENYSSALTINELKDFYLWCINFCIKSANQGDKSYYDELFDIYVAAIENKALIEHKKLSAYTYKNIITLGLRNGHNTWVESFIEQYHSFLDIEFRADFYNYAKAKSAYVKTELKQATIWLDKVNTKDIFTTIDVRVMQCKINYELGRFELLEYMLDNLKQYLKRQKLKLYHKKIYNNFIKALIRILNLNGSITKTEKLRDIITKEHQIAEKKWLLEQL